MHTCRSILNLCDWFWWCFEASVCLLTQGEMIIFVLVLIDKLQLFEDPCLFLQVACII